MHKIFVFFFFAYLGSFWNYALCCVNLWNCYITGGDNEGPWFLPDILVNVRRPGDDSTPGVIREVLPVSILSLCSLHQLFILNFCIQG